MRYLAILAALAVLVAGCTGQTFPGFGEIGKEEVKKLQEVRDFIKDYPNAEISTALYTPNSIKAVLPEFQDKCPSLGEEGKSYSKVIVRDPDTNRGLIVWVDEQNTVICSTSAPLITVPTTAATTTTAKRADGSSCLYAGECISGYCINNICNTPGAAGTTSSSTTAQTTTTAPTTTTAVTTTTANVTTTTTLATTTSTAQTTTTAATTTTSTTTTTTQPKPDLRLSSILTSTNASHKSFSIIIDNIGTVGITGAVWYQYYIYYKDPSTGANVSKANLGTGFNDLAAGGQKIVYVYFNYASGIYSNGDYYINVTVDNSNTIAEMNEFNNERSAKFTKP